MRHGGVSVLPVKFEDGGTLGRLYGAVSPQGQQEAE